MTANKKTTKIETRGRKNVDDKKKGVNIYIRESRIIELGGIEKAREKGAELLNKCRVG